MTPGPRRLYTPHPVTVRLGSGRRAGRGRRGRGRGGPRGVAGRGPLVDAATAAAPLLRAGPRRRPRPSSSSAATAALAGTASAPDARRAPYIELHAHSAFSFLDGASTPTELAAAAAELGYPALALTDHDGIWGSMEFAHACQGLGVRPITGAELTVQVDRGLSRNAAASPAVQWLLALVHPIPRHPRQLRRTSPCWSKTRRIPQSLPVADCPRAHAGRHGADPSQPWATVEQLEAHAEGLVCLSGCARDGALAGAWERGDPAGGEQLGAAAARGLRAASASGSSCSGPTGATTGPATAGSSCSPRGSASPPGDRQRPLPQPRSRPPAGRLRRGPAGTDPGGVRAAAARQPQLGAGLAGGDGGALRRAPRGGRRDAAARRAAALRPHHRARLPLPRARTTPIAPSPSSAATRLIERYAGERGRGEAEARLGQELATIRHLGLSGFFLLHHDLLELAREVAARGARPALGALGPAAGARARLQRQLDRLLPDRPLAHRPGQSRTLPRRFLNDEATSMPDIDLDFPRDIREVLIPRVHERYGADRSALVAAFPTYRPRGVVRDLGKALGLPLAEIEQVAKTVGFHESQGASSAATSAPRSAPSAPPHRAGRRCSGSPARRSACPATPPSTRAGW